MGCSIVTHSHETGVFNMSVASHHPYSPDVSPCDFPKMKFKTKGCHFDTVVELHSRWCWIPLKNRTCRERSKRGRSTGSGVSLHKVTTSKEMAAKFKSATVIAFYRRSL